MEATERLSLIERYRTGTDDVEEALAAVTAAELDRPPASREDWTPRQVVHHLADIHPAAPSHRRGRAADRGL